MFDPANYAHLNNKKHVRSSLISLSHISLTWPHPTPLTLLPAQQSHVVFKSSEDKYRSYMLRVTTRTAFVCFGRVNVHRSTAQERICVKGETPGTTEAAPELIMEEDVQGNKGQPLGGGRDGDAACRHSCRQ